ncbi:MAG TPA: enoyl-CoA hydratase/isomerase family protein, partial [Thauera aminoaromatica]|nr:enoyl-CoA hydratase/isomerase family protein [Thauera aminoaromatica]
MPDPIHGDCVRLEREGGLAFITLDRPQARNALDLAMGLGLRDAVRELAAAPPRVLVLRSSGAHFMVGGDVRRFDALLGESQAACTDEIGRLIDAVHEAVTGLTRLPCPVLGLVGGSVAGFGLALAMACDLLVAADDARLVLAYGAIGATPETLSRLIQRLRKKGILTWSGRTLTIKKALVTAAAALAVALPLPALAQSTNFLAA